jgi:hypothetical protein
MMDAKMKALTTAAVMVTAIVVLKNLSRIMISFFNTFASSRTLGPTPASALGNRPGEMRISPILNTRE